MQQILLIYTGGTIGMVRDVSNGLLNPFDFDNLLIQIPQLNNIEANIDTVSVSNPKDSADMHPEDWQLLGQLIFDKYNYYDGFVVLHGTDTMSFTSSALSFMFENLEKPIIFTGSQLPIGDVRTDALENVLTAIQIALLTEGERPLIKEVGLFFGNKLLRANRSTKISSNQFEAFDSPNYPPLIVSGVRLKVNKELLLNKSDEGRIKYNKVLDERVFLLKLHPAITQVMFEILCEKIDFQILIVESYGSGTVFLDDWFLKSVQKLRKEEKIVVNCSQCIHGGVSEDIYASSILLKNAGVLNAGDMTTESVLAKSMCLLARKTTFSAFKKEFEKSFSGEIL